MRAISDRGSALYNMSLAVGNIISPILGGALAAAGDSHSFHGNECETMLQLENQANNGCYCPFPNAAYDGEDQKNPCIGNGFAYAADVMSMITLAVLLIYGCLGWLFRPKSDFEKMQAGEKEGHTYEDIMFPDSEQQEQKLF